MDKDAAKNFANDWYELGNEKSDTQKFWLTLLRDVFDTVQPEKIIDFEISVANGFIDAYIAKTKVLIEQKSFGVDLTKKILQSDGKFLTPYEQAQRYAKSLSEPPRWIVTCNFAEFRIHKPDRDETTVIKLRDLRYQYQRLRFLIDPTADDSPPEEKISKEALEVISKIYDAFAKNYEKNKVTGYEDALNKICTRLVFCLYAGDANIFDANKFFDYLRSFNDAERNAALQNLFRHYNIEKIFLGEVFKVFKMPKSTGDLFTELKDDKNLKGYLRRNREEFVMPLGEYLEKLLAEKNLTKKEVIERSDLNREYVYHIFSGLKKNPSRPKILAIAMAMELDLEEIQYLLR